MNGRKVLNRLPAAVLALVLAQLAHSPTARAATWIVDTTDDVKDGGCSGSPTCSLREAINEAYSNPGPDTIILPAGIYTLAGAGDDTNVQGDLDIIPGGGDLTISGAGAMVTRINGPGADRVLQVNLPGATVTISGVTIQNGNAPGYGGGVGLSNGTLTIADSTIFSNTSAMGGGAIAVSGISSTLHIARSTIYSNTATGSTDGGGIYNLNRTVTISGSTIYTNTARYGGGVENHGGTVVITNTTVDDNEASRAGGGIDNYAGTVTAFHSTFSNNRSIIDTGGAIYSDDSSALSIAGSTLYSNTGRFGGAIHTEGALTITTSALAHNRAAIGSGGAIYSCGGDYSAGSAVIADCTFADNQATGSGGAIYHESSTFVPVMHIARSTLSGNHTDRYGGGIDGDAPLTITNSTLSGNTADAGGGGIYNTDAADLTNVTITGNTADHDNDGFGSGGGVYNDTGTMILRNTIVAGNFDTPGNAGPGTIYPDLTGSFTGAAYNLIGDLTGSSGTVGTGSDIVSTTPGLGPLADNGGPATGSGEATLTHALFDGSPAIDAVPLPGCVLSTDQRGVARPLRSACDIGAYEAGFRVYLPLVLREAGG